MNLLNVDEINDYIKNLTLNKIQKILLGNGSTLANYPPLEAPTVTTNDISLLQNRLILQDISFFFS